MAGRRALIVANGDYEHDGLRRLRSPAADADALAEVLGRPDIGGFEVEVVRDQPAHTVQARIEDLFTEARPDDVLLLHFSGHGLKSESGELFFAAGNTKPNRLASTATSADFVQRCMRGSRSRSIVLFLDCCYGGAFGKGVTVRAGEDVNVLDSFPTGRLGGGRGRAVISASNAIEYAFEGESLTGNDDVRPSHFTAALVHGLSTGEADRDEDGWVSLNELYDYVFDRVRGTSPHQTPSRDIEMQGELYLARSVRPLGPSPDRSPEPAPSLRLAPETGPSGPRPETGTAEPSPARTDLGLPHWVVLAALPVLFVTASLPWFDEAVTITNLNWETIVTGMFLPNWWLNLAVLVVAVGFLLPNRHPAVAMGLANAVGFHTFWLGIWAADAPSSFRWAGYVYIISGAILFAATGVWYRQTYRSDRMVRPQRIAVLAGSALVLLGTIGRFDQAEPAISVTQGLSALAVAGLVLIPPRISESVRVAVLVSFTAGAVIVVGSVVNYLVRFHDEGATLTDHNGRNALAALTAAGMWIALARPDRERDT